MSARSSVVEHFTGQSDVEVRARHAASQRLEAAIELGVGATQQEKGKTTRSRGDSEGCSFYTGVWGCCSSELAGQEAAFVGAGEPA
eukprot:6206740-Pleurochrysis_carterae.AAC.6